MKINKKKNIVPAAKNENLEAKAKRGLSALSKPAAALRI